MTTDTKTFEGGTEVPDSTKVEVRSYTFQDLFPHSGVDLLESGKTHRGVRLHTSVYNESMVRR